jgi:hypothetical protein
MHILIKMLTLFFFLEKPPPADKKKSLTPFFFRKNYINIFEPRDSYRKFLFLVKFEPGDSYKKNSYKIKTVYSQLPNCAGVGWGS